MKKENSASFQPLAMRMRPRSLNEFYGQSHLVAKGKALQQVVQHGHMHSMIFWGPPGTTAIDLRLPL